MIATKMILHDKLPLAFWAFFMPCATVRAGGIHRDLESIKSSYDYIVAGGGLTGLVVASRLTEDPNTTVLVVEYGDFDDTWNTAMPYYGGFLQQESLYFQVPSTPQSGLNNRTFVTSQGATVGGGTVVNGMAVTRGARSDYDAWQELGNVGWGWDSLIPYFQRSSTLNDANSTAIRAYNYTFSKDTYGSGPFQASWPSWQWPDTFLVNDAWTKDLGFTYRTDGATNGENVGLSWKPISADPKNMTRSSARTAYYEPASKRSNLDLLIRSFVSKVNFKQLNATGVNVMARNSTNNATISAKKEVILAAGALHTPQILQLSGIGPSSVLEPLGIPVIQDLPGVGANLQDHPRSGMTFDFKKQNTVNSTLITDTSSASFNASLAEYMANRTGPLTVAHGNSIIILSLQNLTDDHASIVQDLYNLNAEDFAPELYANNSELLEGYKAQLFITNRAISNGAGVYEFAWGGGDAHFGIIHAKSLSRGTVRIRSTNPHPAEALPVVDFRSLSHPFDVTLAVLGLKLARRVVAAPSLRALEPVELTPGANFSTDADIERALRTQILVPHDSNPCGTAAMMPKELGGVVDSELRVYGVSGLRVVDSSILPVSPNAHMQSSLYAVAEKAADIIKGLVVEN